MNLSKTAIDLEALKVDNNYKDHQITAVTDSDTCCWLVHLNNGVSFVLTKDEATPKPGDTVRLYPDASLGTPIRGVVLNGVPIYYQTQQEQEDEHRKYMASRKKQKRADYLMNLSKYETQLATLPEPFKERVIGFRNVSPAFWEFEPYELFVCTEAVKIAAKIPAGDIKAFYKLPYKEQKQRVPDLSDDHSGNTFDAACGLAQTYLTYPELVPKAHGAMCPLVGCKDYGCVAGREDAAKLE